MTAEDIFARFRRFCRQLPNAEWIDDLAPQALQMGVRRADVLFAGRTVIGEVKTVSTDKEPEIDRALAAAKSDPKWPLFYSDWPIERLLSHITLPETLVTRLQSILPRTAENWVRNANQQIRETKRAIGLPEAAGLLVVLNDCIPVWRADTIVVAVAEALLKRLPSGSSRFQEIAGVWIIDQANYRLEGTVRQYPVLVMPNEAVKGHGLVMALLESLKKPWTQFCGVADAGWVDDAGWDGLFRSEGEGPGSPLPFHKVFRAEYRQNPHLAEIPTERLLKWIGWLFSELLHRAHAPGVLPDRYRQHLQDLARRLSVNPRWERSTLAAHEPTDLLRKWFHALEEADRRGVNLFEMKRYLD